MRERLANRKTAAPFLQMRQKDGHGSKVMTARPLKTGRTCQSRMHSDCVSSWDGALPAVRTSDNGLDPISFAQP